MTFHDCFCGILFFCGTKYLICCMLCENGRTVQKSLDLVHAVPDRVPECWENREGANTPIVFILNLITSNIYERWSCWKLKMQFKKNGFRIKYDWCGKQNDTPTRGFHCGKNRFANFIFITIFGWIFLIHCGSWSTIYYTWVFQNQGICYHGQKIICRIAQLKKGPSRLPLQILNAHAKIHIQLYGKRDHIWVVK